MQPVIGNAWNLPHVKFCDAVAFRVDTLMERPFALGDWWLSLTRPASYKDCATDQRKEWWKPLSV